MLKSGIKNFSNPFSLVDTQGWVLSWTEALSAFFNPALPVRPQGTQGPSCPGPGAGAER